MKEAKAVVDVEALTTMSMKATTMTMMTITIRKKFEPAITTGTKN